MAKIQLLAVISIDGCPMKLHPRKVSSSAVGISSITSASNTDNTDGVSGVSTLDATIGRIHDIPQSAMSRLTGSPTVYAR